MAKIDTVFIHGMNELGIVEHNRLYWNKSPIVTKADISFIWWVNIAIIIGASSTAVLAIIGVLNFLGIVFHLSFKPSWGIILVIFGMLCLVVGPILKDKSRTIRDKEGRKGLVPYTQKPWLYRFGWFLIGLEVLSTIIGSFHVGSPS